MRAYKIGTHFLKNTPLVRNVGSSAPTWYVSDAGSTPARTHSICGLKSRVWKLTFLAQNNDEK